MIRAGKIFVEIEQRFLMNGAAPGSASTLVFACIAVSEELQYSRTIPETALSQTTFLAWDGEVCGLDTPNTFSKYRLLVVNKKHVMPMLPHANAFHDLTSTTVCTPMAHAVTPTCPMSAIHSAQMYLLITSISVVLLRMRTPSIPSRK